jgi:putative glutamine amidotransferase
MKPIIGLTTYGKDERLFETKYYDSFYYVPSPYVDAVRRAGGLPILLPVGEPDWMDWLAIVDGIVVIGGGDIDPDRYGGDTGHDRLAGIDQERDESELSLLRELVKGNEYPTLCICRGMQVLNVALGGTLHEHIPDIHEDNIHQAGDGGWTIQGVTVDPDSFLAEVMKRTDLTTYSGHHQAIKELAPSAKIVAISPDDIIEAIEVPGHPWLVAVQWHPEMSAAEDPSQQRIFDQLVKTAAEYRKRRSNPTRKQTGHGPR